jgi:tartrate-resistant acid phosphatase type 5
MNRILCFTLSLSLSFSSCAPRTGSSSGSADGDSLSFIVLGDWGVGGSAAQRRVAEAMDLVSRSNGVQFIITTGDNFYPVGVASVRDSHWHKSFERVYTGKGHQVPWYPTLGNHDYNGSPAAQIAYSKESLRWQLSVPYYSFRRKAGGASITFAFADMNPFIRSYYRLPMPELKDQDTAAQYRWLEETLSAPADWKLMIGHQPLYSVGSHGSSPELTARFKPLLLRTGTQFYLAGHDHNLQHIRQEGEGVHYLVSGGGGRGLYALKTRDSATRFALSSHGFLRMTFYARKAHFYFYNDKGEVLYQQVVEK